MNHFEQIHGFSYITLAGMQEAARHATECVKAIRQWLPVKGIETLSSELTMDNWHEVACRYCFEFFKFHPRPGTYATVGPKNVAENWRELCDGMADIRRHYKWESIDFESKLPNSNVRGGKKLKPVPQAILARIEQAVAAINSIIDTAPKADWREHTAADAMDLLGVESRDTLRTHAKSSKHPYIEKVSRGRYRIDHSHDYVKGLAK